VAWNALVSWDFFCVRHRKELLSWTTGAELQNRIFTGCSNGASFSVALPKICGFFVYVIELYYWCSAGLLAGKES